MWAPLFGINSPHLTIESLREELKVSVGRGRCQRSEMVTRLLDLNKQATGCGKVAKLLVHDIGKRRGRDSRSDP